MESSTPPASSSADDSNAQDPLALPNTNETLGLYEGDLNRNQNGLCGSNESALSNSCIDKESSLSDNTTNNVNVMYSNDPAKVEEHTLNHEQRLQYDANHQMSSNYDQQKINQMTMQQQQNLHEPHKTFSHSIENLSKTTEKCAPNDIKIFPNLIDGHDQYDDGYETGVGDLLSHKYKLPSLPPPSSSPYSSLSSSSMSTISTATTTPTNLVNPQQQSPSYMGGSGSGNAGNNMNQYQQQQQQQQYHQNHQQYQSMQHPIPPTHQNSFNYHHMFGNRMQQQPQQLSGAIKNEPPMTPTDNDPYRFVDDDLSNGMTSSHSSGMHSSMHPHHQHMSPAGMSGNYSASSSPMPPQMQQQQQQQTPTGNSSMMQFNDHMPHHQHHMHGHHMNHINNLSHQQQQMQSQHINPHIMNGNMNSPNVGHGGMNSMLMNDTPKKRGRKKKLRDENGNPIEDRPVKERKKHDRFNGMPEEEVTKRTLPDHIAGNLDIVIVGINPGLFAAFKGHHYAGPGNHFWKCLYLSGLTSVQMTAEEDYKLLQYGIGFTNMVQRPTKGSADLTRKEIKEGSRILLEKIRKFQPKIAVFNGKLIFEVFSGKKDFCFGKQPETVEGTNTYMWVMPSSSARCAQLPRAADKVPFYAALKKFRDYLNGLVPEYDENDYVFNDPKYSQISTEAELKADESLAFTALEGGEVVMVDPNKKKRGRPKKVRGENGEEIPAPKSRKSNNNNNAENINSEGNDEDAAKKKRGRPKKNKDGTTTPAAPKKRANNKQKQEQMIESNSPQHLSPPSSVPSQAVDINSIQNHPVPSIQQHQQHPGMISNNCSNVNIINRPFLPPMESPNYSNGAISQQNHLQQSQNTSPVNLCFPQANIDQVAQPEMSPHLQQAYQRQTPSAQQQMFGTNSSSPEMPADIATNLNPEQISSPIAASPTLVPTEFEPPQSVVNGRHSNELHPYSQIQSANPIEQQQHQTHSPQSQAQSPISMANLYSQQQQQQQQVQQQQQQVQHQPQMSHMISNISNGSPYPSYTRQHSQQQLHQQQVQQPSYPSPHQQSPHHHAHAVPQNNVNTKQQMSQQQINVNGTDPYKDVATKSLSGLESLVDQIPNLNEQEAGLGSMVHTVTPHNGTPNLAATSPSVASSSSLLPSLGPPHHHSHYSYSSHAAAAAASQSPYSANPFSVSSLTSSTYPSAAAAAMNSYHQNLMSQSHLTSSFMEPPHMPVPVSPALYHSYQQQGYPSYAPPHPSALHMSNYPYYTNSGYTQAPGSSYHHSMFDRINF